MPKPRIHLVLDWDGTMTMEDTTSNIGEAALYRTRMLSGLPVAADLYSDNLMEPYVQQYLADEAEWKKAQAQAQVGPKTEAIHGVHSRSLSWDKKDIAGMKRVNQTLKGVIEQLDGDIAEHDGQEARRKKSRQVQVDSLLRVRGDIKKMPGIKDALDKDPTMFNEWMTERGRQDQKQGKVNIREVTVLRALLRAMEKGGNLWTIVSVSWSRCYILGVMVGAELIDHKDVEATATRIHCNELMGPMEFDEDGAIDLICDSQDKLAELEKLPGIGKYSWHKLASHTDLHPIYVGDSVTDIDCLAASPAIGMFMSQGENHHPVFTMLEDRNVVCWDITYLQLKTTMRDIHNMKHNLQQHSRPAHIVCSLRSFKELRDWILRLE